MSLSVIELCSPMFMYRARDVCIVLLQRLVLMLESDFFLDLSLSFFGPEIFNPGVLHRLFNASLLLHSLLSAVVAAQLFSVIYLFLSGVYVQYIYNQ